MFISGRIGEWVDPDFNSFTNTDSLWEYMMRVHTATEKFLTNLPKQTSSAKSRCHGAKNPTANYPPKPY